jgi:hypothetical protein
MGLHVQFEQRTTTTERPSFSGDRVQLFAPGDRQLRVLHRAGEWPGRSSRGENILHRASLDDLDLSSVDKEHVASIRRDRA